MTSPLSNALGKVVFLGTPFYSKRWAKHAALRVTLSLFLSLVSGFILTFLALTIWGLVTDLSINNNTLYVAGAFAILIFLGNLAAFWERTLFRDGNMYHSDKVRLVSGSMVRQELLSLGLGQGTLSVKLRRG